MEQLIRSESGGILAMLRLGLRCLHERKGYGTVGTRCRGNTSRRDPHPLIQSVNGDNCSFILALHSSDTGRRKRAASVRSIGQTTCGRSVG